VIVVDERNARAIGLAQELRGLLPRGWKPPEGTAIVIGGDGFLLRTVAAHGFDHAWLGLNAGNMGFLLNEAAEPKNVAEKLAAGRWQTYPFPLVEARIVLGSGQERIERAINDVYLERMSGQAALLRLSLNGHEVFDQLVADGIIFATALGSTGYAYSAGGEPLHPRLRVLQVAPICAHRPRVPPVVLPEDAFAEVEILQSDKRPVRAVTDGRGIDDVRHVRVSLSSQSVHLSYFDDHDFTRHLLRTVVQT